MEFLKGMEIAFVHCRLFVEKDLAHEVAVITANDVGMVLTHGASCGEKLILGLLSQACTRAVYLRAMEFWPITPVLALKPGGAGTLQPDGEGKSSQDLMILALISFSQITLAGSMVSTP